MTSELSLQQHRLIAASKLIDERRLFTEAVLSGVPVAVVGVDSTGRDRPQSVRRKTGPSRRKGQPTVGAIIATVMPGNCDAVDRGAWSHSRLVQGQISLTATASTAFST